MDSPIRAGFTLIGGAHWTGGQNYLLNLLRVIARFGKGRVDPILFVGNDIPTEQLEPFGKLLDKPIVRSPSFSSKRLLIRTINSLVLGKDKKAEIEFLSLNIKVVVESATYYGWRFGLPTIAWIPDFQHRHLPHMFGFTSYWKREIGIRSQLWSGRNIILSSESARRDLIRFYTLRNDTRVHVAPFAVMLDYVNRQAPTEIKGLYCLPKDYVFLPNQFFKHKNHGLVVSALHILRKRGVDIIVAASGLQEDPRHPGYFQELKKKVTELELEPYFRFLGVIPYDHLIALMRGALAVLNPSLFEGWSTTVEEAKALDVPLVLSDIPVHREQATEDAYFFDSRDPRALADVLETLWEKSPKRYHDEKSAEAVTRERLQSFASSFIEAILLCSVKS